MLEKMAGSLPQAKLRPEHPDCALREAARQRAFHPNELREAADGWRLEPPEQHQNKTKNAANAAVAEARERSQPLMPLYAINLIIKGDSWTVRLRLLQFWASGGSASDWRLSWGRRGETFTDWIGGRP